MESSTEEMMEKLAFDRYQVLSGSDDWYKKTSIEFFDELTPEYDIVVESSFGAMFMNSPHVNLHDKTVSIASFMIPYGEGDYPVFSFEDGNCILLEYDSIATVKLVIDKAQQDADIERMLYRTVLPEYVDFKHCPDCDVIPVKTGYEEKDTSDSNTYWSISCPSCHFRTEPKDIETAEWFWNMMCDVRKN